jgi:hypothetical protein
MGWIAQLVEQRTEKSKAFIVSVLRFLSPLFNPLQNNGLGVICIYEAC